MVISSSEAVIILPGLTNTITSLDSHERGASVQAEVPICHRLKQLCMRVVTYRMNEETKDGAH